MKLWLKLQGTAGSDIDEVAADMVEVANRLRINVEVRANGIQMLCTPGDTPEAVEAAYYAQLNARR